MATCTIEHPAVCTGGDAEGYTPAGRALCSPCLDSFWDRGGASGQTIPIQISPRRGSIRPTPGSGGTPTIELSVRPGPARPHRVLYLWLTS